MCLWKWTGKIQVICNSKTLWIVQSNIMGTVSVLFSFCGWLGDRGTVVQFSMGQQIFALLQSIKISSGAYTYSHIIGTAGSFSRRGQCKSWRVSSVKMGVAVFPLPHMPSWHAHWQLYLIYNKKGNFQASRLFDTPYCSHKTTKFNSFSAVSYHYIVQLVQCYIIVILQHYLWVTLWLATL